MVISILGILTKSICIGVGNNTTELIFGHDCIFGLRVTINLISDVLFINFDETFQLLVILFLAITALIFGCLFARLSFFILSRYLIIIHSNILCGLLFGFCVILLSYIFLILIVTLRTQLLRYLRI